MAVQLFKELIDENGHLEIPAGTRKILPDTLMNCEDLSSVVIPEGVTIIGVCAFIGCKNLRHVELSEGLRTIDAYAFSGCTALESIIIPQSVRIIAHGAFKGCTGLTHVVVPGSLSIVGEGAFEECTCLTDDDMSLIKAKESPYDSVEISTTACIVGTKEVIIKVLNQAFRLFGSDKIVVDAGSSLEEMNGKIHEAFDRMEGDPDLDEQPDGYGAEFTLLDFLDDNNRMHSPYEDYVLSYIDEEYPDGLEEYRIGLLDVIEDGGEYVARIMSVVNECQDTYLDEDWWDWCERMVRLYGCKVVLHRESGVYESDLHDEETRLFELGGDYVKQTMLDEFPYRDFVQESESAFQAEDDDDLPF